MRSAIEADLTRLDRKTGRFISGVPYASVTSATRLNPKTGRPIEAPNARKPRLVVAVDIGSPQLARDVL
jgi:hypothetical protein